MNGELPPAPDTSHRAGPEPGPEDWVGLLARVQPQLRVLHRMEVVAALAGGVTHEFNNLLLTIRGNVDLLLMGDSLDPSTRARLEQVENAAARATELSRRFQTLAQPAAGKPALIDFNAAAREAVELACLASRRKITFTFESGPAPLPVLMDFTLTVRTLLALCLNAADAMPDGGTVTVTTEALLSSTDPKARLEPPGGAMLRCCVRDAGTGLPSDAGPRLFSPFFTTKPNGRGTGLGLAMVRDAVESHEGRIELQSTAGEGTVVTVLLPLAYSQLEP